MYAGSPGPAAAARASRMHAIPLRQMNLTKPFPEDAVHVALKFRTPAHRETRRLQFRRRSVSLLECVKSASGRAPEGANHLWRRIHPGRVAAANRLAGNR